MAVFTVCVLSTLAIGEKITFDFFLILFTFIILQGEIALITFSISAFLKKGGLGIGLGIAVIFYFLNIISNLTDSLEFLKYLTPFSYTDSGYVTQNHSLDFKYIAIGFAFSILLSAFSIYKFEKRDIQ
jgi:ABC-2 type transport system permease protein